MKVYHLHSKQLLPISLEQAWSFFSDPANLSKITPPEMNFRILHMSGGNKTYAGQIIRYKVGVLPGISVHWMTEITHALEPVMFVDEQRSGPYAFWHHQHLFRAVEGGVEMTDELHYAIPLGILGRLANLLFVGPKVHAIFEYRKQTLERLFPS